jgi:MOB kinase activator 1
MASFITTMFVSSALSLRTSQPLAPTCTLTESSSCVTINTYHCLSESEPVYYSPATHALRDGLSSPTGVNSNARTRGQFKPRNANKGTSSYQLRQFAEATLGSGSLRKAVKLPEGEDLNEWLAVNGKENRNPLNHSSDAR